MNRLKLRQLQLLNLLPAVSNNGRTQNFQTLLSKALELVNITQKQPARAASASNAIYLVRVLFKHLSESLHAVQLAAFGTDTPYTAADIQPSKEATTCTLFAMQAMNVSLCNDVPHSLRRPTAYCAKLCCLLIVQQPHFWIS